MDIYTIGIILLAPASFLTKMANTRIIDRLACAWKRPFAIFKLEWPLLTQSGHLKNSTINSVKNRINELGQSIGTEVPGWQGVAFPPRTPMEGRFCRVELLNPKKHLDDLYDAYSDDREGALWTYMAVGPFNSEDGFRAWLETACSTDDPLFHAIVDLSTDRAVGVAAYMRIQPDVGVIEVGNITFSPRLQKTPQATEAMFLLMARVFDELGYRRYEWKCDSLNAASRKSAERLGFSFDGIFQQAIVYKGRNRDTAWYSILDRHWPLLKKAYLRWLDHRNFDETGIQRRTLQDFLIAERSSSD